MKKTVLPLAALALTVMASAGHAAEWDRIRIATEGAYAPWNLTNAKGELEGFELDLAKDLCARMEAECEVVAQAWEGIVPALQSGRYDAIMAGMSITDERRQVITFSRPYATTPASFVTLEDSPLADLPAEPARIDVTEISDEEAAAIELLKERLDGAVVGVQTATIHENFITDQMGGVAEIQSYDTQENLDLDLQSGRVDIALADSGYWAPLLDSPEGEGLVMVGPGFTGGPFGEGIGVGIRQEDTDLVAKFDAAIEAALADGTIKALTEKWFGFDASPSN